MGRGLVRRKSSGVEGGDVTSTTGQVDGFFLEDTEALLDGNVTRERVHHPVWIVNEVRTREVVGLLVLDDEADILEGVGLELDGRVLVEHEEDMNLDSRVDGTVALELGLNLDSKGTHGDVATDAAADETGESTSGGSRDTTVGETHTCHDQTGTEREAIQSRGRRVAHDVAATVDRDGVIAARIDATGSMGIPCRCEREDLARGVGEDSIGLAFDLDIGAEVNDGPPIGENRTG